MTSRSRPSCQHHDQPVERADAAVRGAPKVSASRGTEALLCLAAHGEQREHSAAERRIVDAQRATADSRPFMTRSYEYDSTAPGSVSMSRVLVERRVNDGVLASSGPPRHRT
jgi:hypothetical protein